MSNDAAGQFVPTPARSPAQFTIVDLLLLVAALGPTLGLLGTLLSDDQTKDRSAYFLLGSLIAWVVIYLRGQWKGHPLQAWGGLCGVLLVLVLPCCLSGIRYESGAALSSRCVNNLKQIALALRNYHGIYGRFPPAYVADAQGRPMHSWRVLILPFLDQKPLYDLYDFNEPWDGPNNSKLLEMMPDVYRCPSDIAFAPATSYVAIVGPETAWPGATSASLSDITDDPAATLLVVESHDAAIPWLQPADLEFPPLLPRINPQPGPGISSTHRRGGAQVALADGSVRYLEDSLTPEQVRAIFTISGGEPSLFD